MIQTLKSPAAVRLISQMFVVDQQRQAILRYVLGLYPVSAGVVKDSKDFAPSDSQALWSPAELSEIGRHVDGVAPAKVRAAEHGRRPERGSARDPLESNASAAYGTGEAAFPADETVESFDVVGAQTSGVPMCS